MGFTDKQLAIFLQVENKIDDNDAFTAWFAAHQRVTEVSMRVRTS